MTENKSWWDRMRGGRKEIEAQLEEQQERIQSLEAELQKLLADLNQSHQEKAEINEIFFEKSRKLQEVLDTSTTLEKQRQQEEAQLVRAVKRVEESEKIAQQLQKEGQLHQEKLQKALAALEKSTLEKEHFAAQVKNQAGLQSQLEAAKQGITERELLLSKQAKDLEQTQQSLKKAQAAEKRVRELEKLLEDNTNRLISEGEKRKELERQLGEHSKALGGLEQTKSELQKTQQESAEKDRLKKVLEGESAKLRAEFEQCAQELARLQKQHHEQAEHIKKTEAALAEATKARLAAEQQAQHAAEQSKASEEARVSSISELQRQLDVETSQHKTLLEKMDALTQRRAQEDVELQSICQLWQFAWLCASAALRDVCGVSAELALWRSAQTLRPQQGRLLGALPEEQTALLSLIMRSSVLLRAEKEGDGLRLAWRDLGEGHTKQDALLDAPVFVALSLAGCNPQTIPQTSLQKTQDALWEAYFSL